MPHTVTQAPTWRPRFTADTAAKTGQSERAVKRIDEYDAAQERGEVGKRGDFGGVTSRGEDTPTVSDLGLTHKDIHEARIIRDAEVAQPGIARRALEGRGQ